MVSLPLENDNLIVQIVLWFSATFIKNFAVNRISLRSNKNWCDESACNSLGQSKEIIRAISIWSNEHYRKNVPAYTHLGFSQ